MGRRSGPEESDLEEKKDPTDTSIAAPGIMPLPPPDRSGWDAPGGDDEEEDEEDEFHDAHPHDVGALSEDPYIYSDDSASLSDAYFYPTDDDLARPPRYREQDPLQYTLATYYGSVLRRERLSSLKEDDVLPPDSATAATAVGPLAAASAEPPKAQAALIGRRRRRTKRREAQRQRLRQREQMARESAVAHVRGQPQDPAIWRDAAFAVVFLVQLFVVIGCAGAFGFGLVPIRPSSFPLDGRFHWQHERGTVELTDGTVGGDVVYADDAPSSGGAAHASISSASAAAAEALFTLDYQNVVALVGITGFYSCILAYISFGCMLILSRALIHVMLVFSILVSLTWGVIGLTLDPYGAISIMGFFSLLLTLGYTIFSWSRIPFAATNLYVALCGIRCTADITLLGVASLALAFGWCVIWSMAFVGLVNTLDSLDCKTPQQMACDPFVELRHLPVYLLLLGSFLWTNAVIKNTVRVIVASTIGTWWTRPHEVRPLCTSAVARPLVQSLTTSFGSICLGSLVVNLAQVVSVLGNCCCCVIGNPDCSGGGNEAKDIETGVDSAADSVGLGRRLYKVGSPLSRFLRCCNRWSFTYVGLYGYGFHEAGDRAIQLFETREWLEVVHDNLIQNVLLMASVVIGGSTGTFAVVVQETDGYYFSSFHMPTFLAFVIGSTLGFVLSNILLLGVVGSAVNTILVCFASYPFEFDANHRRLSDELREMWSQQVWEPQV